MNAFLYDIILYDIIAIHSTVSFYFCSPLSMKQTGYIINVVFLFFCFFFPFLWENGYLTRYKSSKYVYN